MAATLMLGNDVEDGLAPIMVRVQDYYAKIQVKKSTGLLISRKIWERRNDEKYMEKYKDNRDVQDVLSQAREIRDIINRKFESGQLLDKNGVRDVINQVIYRKQIEDEKRKAEEEAKRLELEKRMTLKKFFKKYITDAEKGERLTEKGTIYARGTINSLQQAYDHLMAFMKSKRHDYDFDDIDMSFYTAYHAYLNKVGYKLNTIGKNINWLKTIMAIAQSEGLHNSVFFKDRRFKGARVEVDSIYLTIDDLNKIRAVDLSEKPIGYTYARDLFMLGVWTAQRVSDYNNIQKENIKVHNKRTIEDVPDPENPGKTKAVIVEKEITVVNLQQRKTGAKVAIPCSTELRQILEKYNYEMPHLADQHINEYMKEIAEMAGLTEKVMIESIQGGKKQVEWIPKYRLVHTHTARRTGATLMYLYGMDIYDIMKITGHSTPQTLKRYIKADSLEVIDKITDKYDYFD